MLKKITTKNIPGGHTGVIIKKNEVIRYDTFNKICLQAQRQARRIVQQAELNAEEVHNEAWSNGYAAGMAIAIQDLAKFFNDNEGHKNTIINSALELVSRKLEEFLQHDEAICQILSVLADQLNQELQDAGRISVTVPEKLHAHSYKIKQLFDSAGLHAEIKKSPHGVITVEYGKEIWTYELGRVASNLTQVVVKESLLSNQLQEQCQVKSIAALTSIRDTLNNYLDSYMDNEQTPPAE
ncbi:hypothetical protein [Enterobacter sp. ENT03]|uniref:hypothetical protein n=1 Tax=Enterobacter sp. ENT03 TaxID=2854780 RepID=UPI001C46D109|nr:hypothetical protein [Enterobacter sp. ENT03]MBV7405636.1 hypothetical protein [Enterobacter sp. ENT03]